MKIDQRSRRSVRSAVFIGVLAGSVFTGSGAFADGPIPISQEISSDLDSETPRYGLDFIARNLDGDYVLSFTGPSLELSPQSNDAYIMGTFVGTLDGNGKTLSGLTKPLFDAIGAAPNTTDADEVSTETVEVKNLTLETEVVEGAFGSGTLAKSMLRGGNIENVISSGKLTTNQHYTGGLIGYSEGSISDSIANVEISSNVQINNVGGLVGYSSGEILLSRATGNIFVGVHETSNPHPEWLWLNSGGNFGGLVGWSAGSITSSSATGNVESSALISTGDFNTYIFINSSTVISGGNLGGLVGYSTGEINSSSSYGDVNSTAIISAGNSDYFISIYSSSATSGSYLGGLVGNSQGPINSSNAYGDVHSIATLLSADSRSAGNSIESSSANSGSYVGGLVGYSYGEITNSHARGNVSSLAEIKAGNSQTNIAITNSAINATDYTGSYVGGLVGYQSGPISNSTSIGDTSTRAAITTGTAQEMLLVDDNTILSGNNSGSYVGGLVGEMLGNLSAAAATGDVTGNDYVGGLLGRSGSVESSILGSHATGNVFGIAHNLGGFRPNSTTYLGGLVGESLSTVSNSYATGDVVGIAEIDSPSEYLGGLIGKSDGSIANAFATGNVLGRYSDLSSSEVWSHRSGGLVGLSFGDISNSFATGNVVGTNWIGGLVGINYGKIQNSYSLGNVTNSSSGSYIGGLVGMNSGTGIVNTFSKGNVTGAYRVGSLVGLNFSDISYSYASGYANDSEGFLFGENLGPEAIYSFVRGNEGFEVLSDFPPILEVVNSHYSEDSTPGFNVDPCLNSANPYLISLEDVYMRSDSPECSGGDGGDGGTGGDGGDGGTGGDGGDGGTGGEHTPTPDRPIRERAEKEAREVAETRISEKIEKAFGFKNDKPLPKSAPIAFVEATEKNDLAKIKGVEIAPKANVKVFAKAGEALQISLKSESKEPVELWVKTPDGNWLLAGVITFDKDGKAILPPLQFKSAGDYSLVLNKPSADSAKGSEPLNQSGSVLVVVN